MARSTKPFSLRLDDATRAMLNELKRDAQQNASQIIRELIIDRYQMKYNSKPSCASGDGCVMVSMWLQNRTALENLTRNELPGVEPPPIPARRVVDVA